MRFCFRLNQSNMVGIELNAFCRLSLKNCNDLYNEWKRKRQFLFYIDDYKYSL